MKSLFGVLFLVVLLTAPGCRAQPPVAKITLHVVNQDGQPVSDTEIEAGFWLNSNDSQAFRKRPNKEGYVSFESPVIGEAVVGNVLLRDEDDSGVTNKYYRTNVRVKYVGSKRNSIKGKWQPWNPTIEMVLKEKKNPIPMYATDAQNELILPRSNAWCGFDMEVNDWVKPDGKGRHADVEFFLAWDGRRGVNYRGAVFNIRFPDKDAGCYSFTYGTKNQTCELRSPYHADPKRVYVQKLTFTDRKVGKWFRGGDIPQGTGYVFRTRTRFDDNGRLIGAFYGKVYAPPSYTFFPFRNGVSIRFPYYLNPTENDTNLEYGWNLLKKKRVP